MKFKDVLYTERLEQKVQDLSKKVNTLQAQNDLLVKDGGQVSELEKRIAVLEERNTQQSVQIEILRGTMERPAQENGSKGMSQQEQQHQPHRQMMLGDEQNEHMVFPGVHCDYNTAPHNYASRTHALEADDGRHAGSDANLVGPRDNPLPHIDDLLQPTLADRGIAYTDRYCSGMVVQRYTAARSVNAEIDASKGAASDEPGTSGSAQYPPPASGGGSGGGRVRAWSGLGQTDGLACDWDVENLQVCMDNFSLGW